MSVSAQRVQIQLFINKHTVLVIHKQSVIDDFHEYMLSVYVYMYFPISNARLFIINTDVVLNTKHHAVIVLQVHSTSRDDDKERAKCFTAYGILI